MRDSNPRGLAPNPLSKSALARFTVSPDVHLSLRGLFPNVSGRPRTVTTETRTETSTVIVNDVDHRRGRAELDNNVPEGEVTLILGRKFLHAGSPGAARIDFDGDERQVVRSRHHQHCSSPSIWPSPERRKLGRGTDRVSGSGGRKPCCCGQRSIRRDMTLQTSVPRPRVARVAACLRTRRAAPGEVGNEFRHHGA